MDEIRDRLKALRKVKGWNQEEIALRLGVALRTLQRWEAKKPKLESINGFFGRSNFKQIVTLNLQEVPALI